MYKLHYIAALKAFLGFWFLFFSHARLTCVRACVSLLYWYSFSSSECTHWIKAYEIFTRTLINESPKTLSAIDERMSTVLVVVAVTQSIWARKNSLSGSPFACTCHTFATALRRHNKKWNHCDCLKRKYTITKSFDSAANSDVFHWVVNGCLCVHQVEPLITWEEGNCQ